MSFEKNIRDQRQRQQDEIAKSCDQGNDIEKARKAFPDGYTKTDKNNVKWKKEGGKWVRQKKAKGGSGGRTGLAKIEADRAAAIDRAKKNLGSGGNTPKSGAKKFNEQAKEADKKSMTKTKMATEVLDAMEFLGIDQEKFADMKKEYGSLEKLHTELGKRLTSKNDAKELKPKYDLKESDRKVYDKVIELYKDGKLDSAQAQIDDHSEKGVIVDSLPAKVLKDLGYTKPGEKPNVRVEGQKLSTVTEEYDWGTLVKVEKKGSWRAVLHPEDQKEISKLPVGDKARIKDEQGKVWDITNNGEGFNLKGVGHDNDSYKGHFKL